MNLLKPYHLLSRNLLLDTLQHFSVIEELLRLQHSHYLGSQLVVHLANQNQRLFLVLAFWRQELLDFSGGDRIRNFDNAVNLSLEFVVAHLELFLQNVFLLI